MTKGSPPVALHRLIFLLSIFINDCRLAAAASRHGTTRMELVHRHAAFRGITPPTGPERVRDLLRRDGFRARAISRHRRGPRRQAWESTAVRDADISGEMPMNSAADYGAGEYLVSIRVGRPAQKLMLFADTGSDLTWMRCELPCTAADPTCGPGKMTLRPRPLRRRSKAFHAGLSSSFQPVPCSSRFCQHELVDLFALPTCPMPSASCVYSYSYVDGTTTKGMFANETVVLNLSDGRKRRLHNVLVGCSTWSEGKLMHAADGVLGMGSVKYSFASKAAAEFDGKFSYCLVDHLSSTNVTSFLTFGGTTSDWNLNMHYTDLILGVLGTYYLMDVKGISVGGVPLDIPAGVWDFRNLGGTIIDSGSSLTYLAVPAYKAVMAALTRPLSGLKRVDMDVEPMGFCFNSTAFDEASMPRLAFHFSMGAQFKPPVKNYVIEVKEGVRCLGFISAPWPGTSLIGNIMQQNYLWEFDLKRSLLGYSASHCT